jgi:hypothetical protein
MGSAFSLLELYNKLAAVADITGNFVLCEQAVDEVTVNVRTPVEQGCISSAPGCKHMFPLEGLMRPSHLAFKPWHILV